MTFDTFLETAWSDHGDHPQEVADRLASSLHVVETAEHIPPFARLVMHVYGEHLGQWDRGIALLESLRRVPASAGSAAAAGALDRNIATLRYAGGDTYVLESLSNEDRISPRPRSRSRSMSAARAAIGESGSASTVADVSRLSLASSVATQPASARRARPRS